jgi:hypothetical protein
VTAPKEGNNLLSGYWPRWLLRFWWDLLPGKVVPGQGGLKAPDFSPPKWISETWAQTPEVLDQARKAHDRAMDRASEAEAKSGRTLQLSLALLASAIAILGFQLTVIRSQGWPSVLYLLVLPAIAAAACLALAGAIAAEGDRPGLYHMPGPAEAGIDGNPIRGLVLAEERGRFLANWTSTNKLNDLLKARAWLTRGLVLLVVAATVTAAMQVPSTGFGSGQPTKQTSASSARP